MVGFSALMVGFSFVVDAKLRQKETPCKWLFPICKGFFPIL